jgi:hypothetical protein
MGSQQTVIAWHGWRSHGVMKRRMAPRCSDEKCRVRCTTVNASLSHIGVSLRRALRRPGGELMASNSLPTAARGVRHAEKDQFRHDLSFAICLMTAEKTEKIHRGYQDDVGGVCMPSAGSAARVNSLMDCWKRFIYMAGTACWLPRHSLGSARAGAKGRDPTLSRPPLPPLQQQLFPLMSQRRA